MSNQYQPRALPLCLQRLNKVTANYTKDESDVGQSIENTEKNRYKDNVVCKYDDNTNNTVILILILILILIIIYNNNNNNNNNV